MPLEGARLATVAQDAAALDSQIETLSAPLFSRVQEPDGSDGSVYDIEILAQTPGSSDERVVARLAACTLNIGAPIGKDKIRMVDGKIENLWLKDEESADRLDNIQMLATLLGYVQKFCAGHEVPHLSSIQTADHPTWLREFFTVAGFNRCECLKPEAGGQRFRACLKLQHSSDTDQQTSIQGTSNNQPQQATGAMKEKTNMEVAAQNPATVANPKASNGAPSKNTVIGTNGENSSSATELTTTTPITQVQALEWLSQNKEILSPVIASGLTNHIPTAPKATATQSKAPTTTTTTEKSPTNESEKQTGEKRKREDLVNGSQDVEGKERPPKSRETAKDKKVELNVKQGLTDKAQQPKTNPEPKSSNAPAARYSYTAAQQATGAKSKESRAAATGTTSITDALLAQCDKTAPKTEPKTAPKTSPKQIKKEAPPTQPAFSPALDAYSRSGYNIPAKDLTCYYWATQGVCKHRDEDCTYAHWDTGNVARPPGTWYKKPKASSHSGLYDGGAWSDVNGINIKGLHGGLDGINGSAPTAPRGYDSWRP